MRKFSKDNWFLLILVILILAFLITTVIQTHKQMLYTYADISYLDANDKETGEHLIIKYANLKSTSYDKILVYELENKRITYTGNYKMIIERLINSK